jgi:twitching motility protein PilT
MQDRPLGSRIDGMLEALWTARGTDLLLTAGLPPQIRVHGELRAVPGHQPLTGADTDALLAEMVPPESPDGGGPDGSLDARGPDVRGVDVRGLDREPDTERDFSFSWRGEARIRGNAFVQRGLTTLALRMIPQDVPTMAELGLPPVLADFARRHQGLVLVTGPTGSGKSTTLAAVIDRINTERACHIITIEDPIEYVHRHKRSAVSQREVGTDTASFPAALRAALREDPDVLLVGEMRDLDSIRFALTIAETGHLVFATLHTNDTAQSLARIIDVFPAEQQAQVRVQLAAALTGIVYQRLIPRIGGGMVAAYEVLVANSAVRNLVKEGKTHQLRNALVTGAREGMLTFEQSLSSLVQAGVVSYEDALARSLHPRDVERRPRFRQDVPA